VVNPALKTKSSQDSFSLEWVRHIEPGLRLRNFAKLIPIKKNAPDVIPFLEKFFDLEEQVALESHAIYSRLIVDDVKPLPEAIETVLDQQGKPDLPLDHVVDPSIIDEVLRERR
jgi:hypothetical protein